MRAFLIHRVLLDRVSPPRGATGVYCATASRIASAS